MILINKSNGGHIIVDVRSGLYIDIFIKVNDFLRFFRKQEAW